MAESMTALEMCDGLGEESLECKSQPAGLGIPMSQSVFQDEALPAVSAAGTTLEYTASASAAGHNSVPLAPPNLSSLEVLQPTRMHAVLSPISQACSCRSHDAMYPPNLLPANKHNTFRLYPFRP